MDTRIWDLYRPAALEYVPALHEKQLELTVAPEPTKRKGLKHLFQIIVISVVVPELYTVYLT